MKPEAVRTYSIDETKKGLSRRALVLMLIALALTVALFTTSIGISVYKAEQRDKGVVTGQQAAAEDTAAADEDGAADNDILASFSNDLREEAVDYVFDKEVIPAYSYDQVQAMDMSKPSGVSVADLKLVTRGGLVGHEEAFYQAEQDYGINALFVLGIASHESAYATHCFKPNNMFGFGRTGFSSKEECVDTVAHALAKNYMNGGKYSSGNTIDSVNRRYAADPAWDRKVARKVAYFYQVISANRQAQLEKLK